MNADTTAHAILDAVQRAPSDPPPVIILGRDVWEALKTTPGERNTLFSYPIYLRDAPGWRVSNTTNPLLRQMRKVGAPDSAALADRITTLRRAYDAWFHDDGSQADLNEAIGRFFNP